jgi:2-polyprenyl-6-hydroxyphenyl methylase/3-demethylubiquinone-9 3-methyltransferase
MTHTEEILSGERFAFGENWARFLSLLDEDRIQQAEASLKNMLEIETLAGKRFLDAGSGSGLFSLAARRLGAKVYSFDYDPQSVACTAELKLRYFPGDPDWVVAEASVLDKDYLARLGVFDVVYSWGVLHHTGAMWQALENVAALSAKNGKLFIAIYNDQGRTSVRWLKVKQAYNALPIPLRWPVLLLAFVRLWGPTTILDLLRGSPFLTWMNYSKKHARGMDPWRDVVDWVGGLPFEVAKPEQIFDFLWARDFHLVKLTTCAGGLGCNEFVFKKQTSGV